MRFSSVLAHFPSFPLISPPTPIMPIPIVSFRYARTFIFFYSIALHLLVFFCMYRLLDFSQYRSTSLFFQTFLETLPFSFRNFYLLPFFHFNYLPSDVLIFLILCPLTCSCILISISVSPLLFSPFSMTASYDSSELDSKKGAISALRAMALNHTSPTLPLNVTST